MIALVIIIPVLVTQYALVKALPSDSLPDTVNLLYAGSLVDLMQRYIGPSLLKQYYLQVSQAPIHFNHESDACLCKINGTSAGSGALATSLKKGAYADVFISADAAINIDLMNSTIIGTSLAPATWYIPFSSTRLGLAYSLKSPFLDTFKSIQNGEIPWYVALDKSYMKIGRTDPNSDPKGA